MPKSLKTNWLRIKMKMDKFLLRIFTYCPAPINCKALRQASGFSYTVTFTRLFGWKALHSRFKPSLSISS